MSALVLSSDVKGIRNLTGVIGEYLHQQAIGFTLFDDVEPGTLRDITTIVVFDRQGNPHVYTVVEMEDDVDMECDTALEEKEVSDDVRQYDNPSRNGLGIAAESGSSNSNGVSPRPNRKKRSA
jgi:hypothetical protein